MLKLVVVVIVLAALTYVLVRALQQRGIAPGGASRRPTRPISPDDDPDFLRDLEFRRWQQQRHPKDEGGESEVPHDG